MQTNVNDLKKKLIHFRDERDWKQFHNPKDLALSISLEAAELLEIFQWKTKEDLDGLIETRKNDIADEMADVFAYLLILSDATGIDLEEALINKLEKNKEKYPIDKVKGSSKKYTDY